jgi:hypothetical protein
LFLCHPPSPGGPSDYSNRCILAASFKFVSLTGQPHCDAQPLVPRFFTANYKHFHEFTIIILHTRPSLFISPVSGLKYLSISATTEMQPTDIPPLSQYSSFQSK